MIDVRCRAQIEQTHRCQLFAGHEGSHTQLIQVGEGRVLRKWTNDGTITSVGVSADEPLPLPWAPGCPLPIEEFQLDDSRLHALIEAADPPEARKAKTSSTTSAPDPISASGTRTAARSAPPRTSAGLPDAEAVPTLSRPAARH